MTLVDELFVSKTLGHCLCFRSIGPVTAAHPGSRVADRTEGN